MSRVPFAIRLAGATLAGALALGGCEMNTSSPGGPEGQPQNSLEGNGVPYGGIDEFPELDALALAQLAMVDVTAPLPTGSQTQPVDFVLKVPARCISTSGTRYRADLGTDPATNRSVIHLYWLDGTIFRRISAFHFVRRTVLADDGESRSLRYLAGDVARLNGYDPARPGQLLDLGVNLVPEGEPLPGSTMTAYLMDGSSFSAPMVCKGAW